MYLVYGKEDGKVWREVDTFVREADQIRAGINGQLTLTYPDAVNVDVLEITDAAWEAMDQDHIGKYMVVDGAVVEDPDYVEPSMDDMRPTYDIAGAVADGTITPEQYQVITGQPYVAPEE